MNMERPGTVSFPLPACAFPVFTVFHLSSDGLSSMPVFSSVKTGSASYDIFICRLCCILLFSVKKYNCCGTEQDQYSIKCDSAAIIITCSG